MAEVVDLHGAVVHRTRRQLDHVAGLVAAATEGRQTSAYPWVPADRAEMTATSRALADWRRGWAMPFSIWAGGRIVGSTRCLDLDYWDRRPPPWPPGRPSEGGRGVPSVAEIGSTWLAASARGTPVNAEANYLLLGQAFEVWSLRRVSFKTDARNLRSRRAIERLAAFEGIRRAHVLATDLTVRDRASYSILRSAWPEIRARLEVRLARATGGSPTGG